MNDPTKANSKGEPKEVEIVERKVEPMRDNDQVPEELLDLFGLPKEKGNARGLIETAFGNLVERKKLKSEIKTARARRAYKQEILEDDKLDTALIEVRLQKLKSQFEAGLLSKRQMDLLQEHFPEVYEMVTEAKEIRKLKHLAEMAELEAKIAEARRRAERDGLQLYRERWQKLRDKCLADLRGKHELRTALLSEIEKIARQMKEDGRSQSEIEFLREQLKRDLEQIIINLGEEGG